MSVVHPGLETKNFVNKAFPEVGSVNTYPPLGGMFAWSSI